MSERELRSAIQRICDDLDLRARKTARSHGRKVVYPLMVGASLLVATCDDDTGPVDEYGAPLYGVPAGTVTGTGTETGTQTGSPTGSGGEGGQAGSGGQAGGAAGAGGEAGGAGGAGGQMSGSGGG